MFLAVSVAASQDVGVLLLLSLLSLEDLAISGIQKRGGN
jgi:hypothetical protein